VSCVCVCVCVCVCCVLFVCGWCVCVCGGMKRGEQEWDVGRMRKGFIEWEGEKGKMRC